jgi:hypothetical protein
VPREKPQSVWYFDFSTEKSHAIFEAGKAFNDGLSVSPDERWIIYSQIVQSDADIMLVDHFQ